LLARPAHLSAEYGAQFQDESVVTAYPNRPPYPAETFEILAGLMVGKVRTVLDAGCGDGALARNLIPYADRIDAIDISRAMIEQGCRMPNGGDSRLRWVCSPIEEALLAGPYALITAGASLHWMEWEVVLPRFAQALSPGAMLAIVDETVLPLPWSGALLEVIQRYSTNQQFQPYDIVHELEERQLFTRHGEHLSVAVPFAQSISAYIESFHARNGFSRDRMTTAAAQGFDAEVETLLEPFCTEAQVTLLVGSRIVWGRPRAE
jgi:SAM-dependent methyltransferase